MLMGFSDIVKVRLQTSTNYSNALECATKIFKDEGASAFYKVGPLHAFLCLGRVADKVFRIRREP